MLCEQAEKSSREISSEHRHQPPTRPPFNLRNLGCLLSIVKASSEPAADFAKIAARKANARYNPIFSPTWYATWDGFDPVAGIPALAARLAALDKPAKQTNLALRFGVALLGGRQQEGRARLAYRTVEHMKALYLLILRVDPGLEWALWVGRTDDCTRPTVRISKSACNAGAIHRRPIQAIGYPTAVSTVRG
ncbi:hypothetical protein GCM10011494_02940 [Novosphingobium endophyticum]|uniref:Uncharacterized protein n=1 Tax=Novosphingobium endophyticum TaxID=1955250 RepID=A0A916X4E7_9SPHN|nr:hypothetical protein [Novosphingobium endophyticum]GGB88016.1 hypothetical protein GCM10011494_02940 [Novosphingobium endophyticum]